MCSRKTTARKGVMATALLALPLLALAAAALPACTSPDAPTAPTERGDVLVEAEVERRVEQIPYLHGVALVHNLERLAQIGQPAVPRLLEAARDERPAMRGSAAWTLGAMGDRAHIPVLRELLDDRVGLVRYEAASSLLELGDSAGFPVLVEGLSAPRLDARYKCFQALREVTGRDFGYRHDADPELRQAAVARWLDWLEDVQANAL